MPPSKDTDANHDARSRTTLVSIAAARRNAPLSKGQKAFNRLVKQIEAGRARLAAWNAVEQGFQKQYREEWLPLERVFQDLREQMVHLLDRACDQKGLTKTERQTIAHAITGMAGALLAQRDDDALKAIYNRHSASDYDSEVAADLEQVKATLAETLGINLDENVTLRSPEDLMRQVQAHMEQQQARHAAAQQAAESRRARRKPSAKQLAAQARIEAEQAQLSQSVREVYRKLASALHPDRESDLREKVRKTALMQRVNQAYGKNDILQLLALQLELEHIDQNAINHLDEDRLKQYTRILKDQLVELNREMLHVEDSFKHQYERDPFLDIHPDTVMRELAEDIARIREDILELEADLSAFKQVGGLKAWLKTF